MDNLFKNKQTTQLNKPPKIVDVLHDILIKTEIPNCMPQRPYEAAHYWINHQEGGISLKDRPTPIEKDNQVIGWSTPYHDRLAHNLRKFLSMSEAQQIYIITNIDNGIPWNGDEIASYAVIVGEHQKMQEQGREYIDNAISQMKKLSFQ